MLTCSLALWALVGSGPAPAIRDKDLVGAYYFVPDRKIPAMTKLRCTIATMLLNLKPDHHWRMRSFMMDDHGRWSFAKGKLSLRVGENGGADVYEVKGTAQQPKIRSDYYWVGNFFKSAKAESIFNTFWRDYMSKKEYPRTGRG